MIITKEQFSQLTRIYNTLLEISTKGTDTLIMADCMRAINNIINEIENNQILNQEG